MAFNGWLLASLCLFPIGAIFALISIPLWTEDAIVSGITMFILGIIMLLLAVIFLIVGLIRYGQQKKF
jgi:hypothetical protein